MTHPFAVAVRLRYSCRVARYGIASSGCDQGDVQVDFESVANQDSTGFECGIPVALHAGDLLADLSDHFLKFCPAAAGDEHVGAFRDEPPGGGQADAAV